MQDQPTKGKELLSLDDDAKTGIGIEGIKVDLRRKGRASTQMKIIIVVL
jgi:hypothetical protein